MYLKLLKQIERRMQIMTSKSLKILFSMLLMAGMVLSSVQPASVAAKITPAAEKIVVQPDGPVTPGGKGSDEQPLSKLDNELQTMAQQGGTEPITIYILASPDAQLDKVVNVIESRIYPDGRLIVATVRPNNIVKMATNPGVKAAEVFHPIEPPTPLTPKDEPQQKLDRVAAQQLREQAKQEIASGTYSAPAIPAGVSGPQATSDWHGVDLIGAPQAWEKGFTGEGVNIAIIDSGVDFGHPDLQDKVAYYDSGLYQGWPIALDPRSMRQYYYNGLMSSDNFADDDDYSWYADVFHVINCTDGMTQTFTLDEYTYTIAPSIVAMSKSGEIRWGYHPDAQFADYVSSDGEWMPFILLDTNVAGVYDTVLADMNYDKWFDQYDDTAVLGTTDPILNQDIGAYVYTDTQVMTGTLYVPSAFYGIPPLWYGWDETDVITTLPAGSFIYATNHLTGPTGTNGADGVADISGGLVYFVADGKLPVPAMNYLYPGYPPSGKNAIPLNGQMVAFMLGSDYAGGGDHGTLCASAAGASGQITGYFGATGELVQYSVEDPALSLPGDVEDISWLKPADVGTVQGPAKGAGIIAIGDNYAVVNGMQGFYDAYTFLAYGVDGVPNSGDEFAQVVSMSYGDGSIHNSGWDWESRLISYYNRNYLPNTTFLASSGNGGHGFGTVNSPQGDTVVTVGASTQYGASTAFGAALLPSQINDGEVTPFSDRGPDALGRPDPDVTATGAWGAGDVPLNLSGVSHYVYGGAFPGDGNNAWEEWGGTSRSAPEAAGVMALVYQAYKDANGVFPDFETARQILMSGANDLGHDVLMQGAGRVNADRATDVAGNMQGVFATPSELAAGDYKGQQYPSFANVLYPGDSWSQTFTVNNTGSAAASVTLGDEVLQQMQVLTYTQVVSPYLGTEGPYPDTYYYYADYFVGGDPATSTHGADLVIPVPEGADFMKVALEVPMEVHDFDYQDPDPSTLSYGASGQRWSLTVYDWTDRNMDDLLWTDTNLDGVVSTDAGDLVEVSATGTFTQTEINRYGYSYNYANEQEVTVDLADKTDPQIVVGLVHRNPNTYRDMGSPSATQAFYQENPLKVKVYFYQKADWSLVDESTTSLNVPAGGSATFDAQFTIPDDQPIGLYEGAITMDDGLHKSIIPVTVNVVVPSTETLFTLGGTPVAGTPYDNGRMFGGYTWSSPLEQSDWRTYFYDANPGMQQQYLYLDNTWGELCSNMPTFNETLVFGPNSGDQFSMKSPDTYGPYGMLYEGGTSDANGPQNGWGTPRVGSWWTNGDNIALPESRSWSTLADGLNLIRLRNILLSGKEGCGSGFQATGGVFGVDAPGLDQGGYIINTDKLSGSFDLKAVSPVDGLVAYATGFGQSQSFRGLSVPQGYPGDSYIPDDLMSGWVYKFKASNNSGIDVRSFGPDSSDVDLYLLYDANNDGVFNFLDNREVIGESTSGSSDESIFYSGSFSNGNAVQDGNYAIVLYGYSVKPGDLFDVKLSLYDGSNLAIQGANAANNFKLDTNAGEIQDLKVNWSVPGSGVWYGYMWFGMPWEESPSEYIMGPGIFVPVTVNAGGIDLSQSTKTVDKTKLISRVFGESHEIITYTITVVNTGNVDTTFEIRDLLPEGLSYEYTARQPTEDDQTTSYIARWWNDVGQHGYLLPDEDGYLMFGCGAVRAPSTPEMVCPKVGPSTSGKLYIQYRAKVETGFAGAITNRVDISTPDQMLVSRMATTDVYKPLFMPLFMK
jgi:uncharacterized repeat protein (TIGR01451 family)